MVIIEHYSRCLTSDGYFKVISKKTCTCPVCHGQLRVRDSKQRRVINQAGKTEVYRLRRYKCQDCGKLHTELPSCIAPYKHYAANVIGAEIFHVRKDCPAESSTCMRWRQLAIVFLRRAKESSLNNSKRLSTPYIKQDCNNPHPLCLSFGNMQCYDSC